MHENSNSGIGCNVLCIFTQIGPINDESGSGILGLERSIVTATFYLFMLLLVLVMISDVQPPFSMFSLPSSQYSHALPSLYPVSPLYIPAKNHSEDAKLQERQRITS